MLKWLRRPPKAAPAATRGSIEIHRPWARRSLETPERAGGFFVLTNTGPEPDRLVGATSPAAEKIEIHAIKVIGGDIGMRPREDGLVLPAGGTLTLQPRGYHLLLLGLGTPPMPGTSLPVTLNLEKAGNIDIELLVEAPGPVGKEVLVEERQRG
ncbi:MAG: copper chaperone PCu(A)C [Reyranella sp.]